MAKASFMHNLEDLRDDLDELKEVVGELFSDSEIDTNVARKRITRQTNKTLKHLGNTFQNGKYEALDRVQHQLTERPVLTAVGAFAAGMVLGRLTARTNQ